MNASLLRRTISFLAPFILFGAVASAQQEATILKIVGDGAQVVLPDGRTVKAEVGLKVPEAATVRSGAAEVYLEAVSGVIATVKRDSEIVVTTLTGNAPTLELKGGNLVSQIDRTKLAGRTYGVKTPRGVAAARGTVYTVNVQGTNYTVVTASGTVTISAPNVPAVTLGAGGIAVSTVNTGAAMSATALAQSNPEVMAAVNQAAAVAVAAVAVVAANPVNFGASTSATASVELTTTVATVVNAVPTAVAQAAATSGNAQAVTQVAQTVTQAAAQGAAQSVAAQAASGAGNAQAATQAAAAAAQQVAQQVAQAATQAVQQSLPAAAAQVTQAAAQGAAS
ncbi:MAG: FecR domain-containing protein, partial [Opitutaceae bacterium]